MYALITKPLDETLASWWNAVSPESRKALMFVIGANLLAFGFEMSNLTLHHDDVVQIFIQDSILGHYLGRFGLGWLHFYGQNAYLMPFLQMFLGILFMSIYGILIARFWGASKTLDITLTASIVCLFPYMAQVYQYNTAMATYSLAHLLAAAAVIFSVRGTLIHAIVATLLYIAAFSIYQSVIANAATAFVLWLLFKLVFRSEEESLVSRAMLVSVASALLSVIVGGLLYMLAVSSMDLNFDSTQAAGEAFNLSAEIKLGYVISEILRGTRSFFLWPENYFPGYLKNFQLLFVAAAAVFCLLVPKGPASKIAAILLLALASFTPRILQLVHPGGTYHNLTLTAYALVIAAAVLMINRAARSVAIRNMSSILALLMTAAYALQCNWISTVNYLNTLAHYTTLTQILARVRSLPDENWDGRRIVVVGRYDMPSDYPFKSASGVAVEYLDASHMQRLASLMRDDVTFLKPDGSMPEVLKYAATHPAWPAPGSLGVVNDVGVVIFSKDSKMQD
jgi:hypothetical protein